MNRTQPVVALLGDVNLEYNKEYGTRQRIIVRIGAIHIHPQYDPPLKYHDIALIQLQWPVTISKYIRPACLPNPEKRLDQDEYIQATGWGLLGFGGE